MSTTEILDCVYTPCLPVADQYSDYFTPTNIINRAGELNDQIANDVMATRHRTETQTIQVR